MLLEDIYIQINFLCKRCNNTLGDTADAKLAEDLSFYTDMLKVKKVRKNPHKQIMLDDEGREVAVYNAGEKIELRRHMWIKKKIKVISAYI